MIHAEAEQLLAAGSVLDDLDPDERRAYDGHRRTCAACRSLERDLDRVLADLALAAPERRPPRELFDDVRAAIGLAEPSAPPTQHLRRSPGAPFLAALGLAAALGVVAVGLGLRTTSLADELAAADARLAGLQAEVAAEQQVIAAALAPDHVTATLHAEPVAPAASAHVVYRPGTKEAYLVAHGLPPTPAGSVYQLWYADEAGVHALGTYAHDGEGPFVAPFGIDLAESAAAMVTLEPVGGASGEPGPQVVFGEL